MALLSNTPAKFAMRLAETLRCKIEGLGITAANQTISQYVTISIGVIAIIPDEKSSSEEF